jgi:aminoglycoside phosphotransferase family enzyme/predicted kinase
MSAHIQHDQRDVIAFLADPASHAGADRVERLETHGNLIFLAGGEAWKIKRAVRFPYMDFSTLEKRHAACLREVEINRRFAPDLYLGCVAIGRMAGGRLTFGTAGDIVEWAVHMRRFEQSALLSSLAAQGAIAGDLARRLGDMVYASHQGAERAAPPSGSAAIREVATAVSDALAACGLFDPEGCRRLQRKMDQHLKRVAQVLDERARHGHVRRCHGDLHLANVVMWRGHPVLYDAIEFDEAIATIDTLYDLAFLVMDLDCIGQRPAANAVLNRYLWRSREDLDLEGLAALPLFLALRASVRAMVTVHRAAQEREDARRRDIARAYRYFEAALGYLAPAPARLVAVGGLSGTGKTTLAAALAPRIGCAPGAVHLRSDLERKALAGVAELERLPGHAYTAQARAGVYRALEERARLALAAGHCVIVDAVLASESDRAAIEAVAAGLGVPFTGLWLEAEPAMLEARVADRRDDASDATPETVRAQLRNGMGALSPAWITVDAGGTVAETVRRAASALGIGDTALLGGRTT